MSAHAAPDALSTVDQRVLAWFEQAPPGARPGSEVSWLVDELGLGADVVEESMRRLVAAGRLPAPAEDDELMWVRSRSADGWLYQHRCGHVVALEGVPSWDATVCAHCGAGGGWNAYRGLYTSAPTPVAVRVPLVTVPRRVVVAVDVPADWAGGVYRGRELRVFQVLGAVGRVEADRVGSQVQWAFDQLFQVAEARVAWTVVVEGVSFEPWLAYLRAEWGYGW